MSWYPTTCRDCGAPLPMNGDYLMPCETPACAEQHAAVLRRVEAQREHEEAQRRQRAAVMQLIGAGLACGVATGPRRNKGAAVGSKKTSRHARVIKGAVYRRRARQSR